MHKSRGMTLLSILIAMGLFGVLLLGIMSAMTLMNKSERNFRQDSETTMLVENINAMLKDSTACVNTFAKPAGSEKNPNAGGVVFSQIMNKANVEAFKTGNTYGAGNVIKITQMKISNFTPANTAEGIADLDIEITKEGPQGIGPKVLKRQIKIFAILFDATGNGKIKFCQALGESQIWQYASNGTDIFYSGGKVGIGTNAPQALFDVTSAGNTRLQISTTGGIGTAPGIQFYSGAKGNNRGWILYRPNNFGDPDKDESMDFLTGAAGVPKMKIMGDGNTFIGGMGGPQVTLTVDNTVIATSDRSLKTNIQNLENSLENLDYLHGVSFHWKKKKDEKAIGLIAQDVEKIYPELVKGEAGSKGINYSGFTAVLLEAIKELKGFFENERKKILFLEQEIKELKTQLQLSQKRIKKLEKRQ